MSELIRFVKNVPQVIALQFAEGKVVQSTIPNSPDSVMYTLATPPGARTFLPLTAAEMIRRAGIAARTPFEICKVGKDDYRIRELGGAGAASTAPRPVSNNYTNSTAHNHNPDHAYRDSAPLSLNSANHSEAPAPQALPSLQSAPQHTPQPTPQSARMMACFLAAIDAVSEAQAYAKRKGLGITFSSENVTSAALSCYINECRNGGAR